MKLLSTPIQAEPEFREVGGYVPGFFGRLLGLPVVKAEMVYIGKSEPFKTQLSIDFESTLCNIGVKHYQPVAFGDVLYVGIKPIRHLHGNVYACEVDEAINIRVEKAYKSDEWF